MCIILYYNQNCFLNSMENDNEIKGNAIVPEMKLNESIRCNALSNALNDIIWNSVKYDDNPKVFIVLPRDDGSYEFYEFYKRFESLLLICENISIYMSENGILLFLYSVILSRGIDRVISDQPFQEPLISMYGNTSMELLNLLLVGVATQYVFIIYNLQLHDGIKKNGDMVLKGIEHQPDIGLLTIYESFKQCKCGYYLKYPLYPIWIICGETHISYLF